MVYGLWRKGCVYEADYVLKLARSGGPVKAFF
jgi:hypothetical protein